jgi:hypothetical protein
MAAKSNSKVLTRWDELIQDANRQIATAKERIATLRKTIRSLKHVRDSGQSWPGDKRSA